MRCQTIMRSPVECARQDEPLTEIARRMRESNIGFMPVCGGDHRVIGVVTDRDIAVRAVAEDQASGDWPVGDIMTEDVITCRAGDELTDAVELMRRHRASRIVVTDLHGVPFGVISLADLAQVDAGDAGG